MNNERFYYSETPGERKHAGGRPANPDKLHFRSMGLRSADWDYLRLWQVEGEGDNFTPALQRLVEFLRIFAPGGPEVEKPRDDKGRFLPAGGTSKSAIQRRNRRKRETEAETDE